VTGGTYDLIAGVCTTGSSSNNPRSFTDSTMLNNPVKHGRGVHLEVEFEDDTNLKFYGVRIQYHHGTT
jgi:hypothetical protein